MTRAIDATKAALGAFRTADDPGLYLCARYNLARYLTEDGQYREAAELLALDEGFYREVPEAWTQLRLSWLQGKIAAGLGRSEEAERIFLEVRDEGAAALMLFQEVARQKLLTVRSVPRACEVSSGGAEGSVSPLRAGAAQLTGEGLACLRTI